MLTETVHEEGSAHQNQHEFSFNHMEQKIPTRQRTMGATCQEDDSALIYMYSILLTKTYLQ